jgi:hypothetical protein
MFEPQEVATATLGDPQGCSSEGRKMSFQKFILQVQTMPNPLQIDMQMRQVMSPTGTETPPLSPSRALFIDGYLFGSCIGCT